MYNAPRKAAERLVLHQPVAQAPGRAKPGACASGWWVIHSGLPVRFDVDLIRSGRRVVMTQSACPGFFVAAPMGRREFLRAGSLSLLGLGMPDLLQAQHLAAQALQRRKAKACILLFMWGGPAHQDTWDMKPAAPAQYRGEFKPIATAVPGIQICEHLPRLARHVDKLAIIRSMTHNDVDHTNGTHYLLTGRAVPRPGA